jgi:hypothetical protein
MIVLRAHSAERPWGGVPEQPDQDELTYVRIITSTLYVPYILKRPSRKARYDRDQTVR